MPSRAGATSLRSSLALLLLLAVSCAPATPRFDPVRLTGELRRPLADWVGYWRGYDPAFALDSLRWERPDSLRFELTRPVADSARADARSHWYAWSPDRSRAVDPDAYRQWDAERKVFDYEPDAEAVLLDFIAHTRARIHFCGTGCRTDAAAWLDRERFALMGWEAAEPGESLYRPMVLLYDLDRRTVVTGRGRAVRMMEASPAR